MSYKFGFPSKLVGINFGTKATEFTNFSTIIAPGSASSSLQFTISFFFFIPEKFSSPVGSQSGEVLLSALEWGPIGNDGPGAPLTSSVQFSLSYTDDTFIVFGQCLSGSMPGPLPVNVTPGIDPPTLINILPDPGFILFGPGVGIASIGETVGKWHHFYQAVDMTNTDKHSKPDQSAGIIDFYSCIEDLYYDSVVVDDTGLALPTPIGRTPLFFGNGPLFNRVSVDPVRQLPLTFRIESPPADQTVNMPLAGVYFGGGFGVPNRHLDESQLSFRATAGDIGLAGVQVWTNKYIAPTADNLAKFVQLDKNGNPLMVSPVVAAKEFGPPTYSFDGPPNKFIKGAPSVFGSIGGDIIPIVGPHHK